MRLKALKASAPAAFIARLVRRYQNARVAILAAALAYYAAFSLGPLLLLLTGGIALVLRNRQDLSDRYRMALIDFIPQVLPVLEENEALINQAFESMYYLLLEGAFVRTVLSILFLIWASTNFFASLQLALEVIFNAPHPRAFWRKRLVAILLVVTVALVIAVEIVGGSFYTLLSQSVTELDRWLKSLSEPFPFQLAMPRFARGTFSTILRLLIAASAFTLAFRYLPRRSSGWLGAVIGGLFSTLSIALMREGLLLFIQPERFNLIYGVITSLLLVLLWLYFALLLILLGALLAAEISALRKRSIFDLEKDEVLSEAV